MTVTRRDALIASSMVLGGAAALPGIARAQTLGTGVAHSQTIAPGRFGSAGRAGS